MKRKDVVGFDIYGLDEVNFYVDINNSVEEESSINKSCWERKSLDRISFILRNSYN